MWYMYYVTKILFTCLSIGARPTTVLQGLFNKRLRASLVPSPGGPPCTICLINEGHYRYKLLWLVSLSLSSVSFSLSLSLSLAVSLFVYLFICLRLSRSLSISAFLFVYLFFCLSLKEIRQNFTRCFSLWGFFKRSPKRLKCGVQ